MLKSCYSLRVVYRALRLIPKRQLVQFIDQTRRLTVTPLDEVDDMSDSRTGLKLLSRLGMQAYCLLEHPVTNDCD